MANIAIIEAKVSRNNYPSLFKNSFEFDQYQLCDNPDIKKVLKKDVNIEIELNNYEWIILVGSESLKFFTGVNSITEYSGRVVDKKFLPVINPAMLTFKPEAKKVWEDSRDSILGYIEGTKKSMNVDGENENFIGITEEEEALKYIQAAIDAPATHIGLDSETTSFYPRTGYVLGISLSYEEHTGAYISSDCITDEVISLLQKLCLKKMVVFHNAKFDMAFLEYQFGLEFPFFEDTMILHYLLEETPMTHGLKQLALRFTEYGDYEKPMHDWIAKFKSEHRILKDDFNFSFIPFDIIKTYAALDACVTFLIYNKFKPLVSNNDKLNTVYSVILLPAIRMLTDIQDNGVPFDKERLQVGQELMLQEITEAVEKLYAYPEVQQFAKDQGAPFNPNSVVQLRKLLFDYIGLQPTGKLTAKGAISTSADVLEKLGKVHEVPYLILNIRKKTKIKNTYLDKIIPQLNRDSRLRTNFNLHTTTSGRLSSSGTLNMQQLPRDNPIVKGCIKAGPGKVIHSVDLQTAEMYCAAVLSSDIALQEIFKSGGNFHSRIAHTVFNLDCDVDDVAELYPLMRQAAKAVSFGIMYGAGANKISEQVTADGGNLSPRQASQVIKDYFAAFPQLEDWIERSKETIQNQGFVYSHFGRKRRLPNVKSDNKGIVGHEVRSGLNFLVQSVASDITLMGAVDAHNKIRVANMDTKIFALVHDSILAEVPVDEVDEYTSLVVASLQRPRAGLVIPGCPIGCDTEVGEDYSFGKYEKLYATAN